MALSQPLLVLAAFCSTQAADTDFQHDFRGDKPLPAKLSLFGPGADNVVQSGAEGLRITPPQDGRQTWGWGVVARYALSGDFEVTATYEILALDPPQRGAGAGVALNVAADVNNKKFAKIGRFQLPKRGDCFIAEFRGKDAGKNNEWKSSPAEARAGKLRLVRKDAVLHFLVADGPDADFREIAEWEYGTEDLAMVRFIANNNTSPTALDARLLELKIRSGNLIPTKAIDLTRSSLPAVLLGALLLTLLVALGVWGVSRRRRNSMRSQNVLAQAEETDRAAAANAPMITWHCQGCAKVLKVQAELAGKKVKCLGCGQMALAPEPKAAES